MKRARIPGTFWIPAALFILYIAAISFRPLLPIDETRYMSVAWEMHLRQGWFQPLTMNFAPYHHKPPLLFWLINMSWALFGVSRWAGLIPLVLSSLATVFLTMRLGRVLFRGDECCGQRIALIMMAGAPFLIYSTIILFDITLTVFVLLTLITVIQHSRKRHYGHIILIGLFMGLGVLTKGPVAYLYVLPPMLLAPLWVDDFKNRAAWYGGCLAAVILSAIPVLLWLIPVLGQSDNNFAFWLVWNQTAGRVTGNFSDAHNRPFYFYLPLLPLMLAPWIFFPAFWRNVAVVKTRLAASREARFLVCWLVPVFAAFCAISGKQPHYLMPLLPGFVLVLSITLRDVRTRTLAVTLAVMMAAVVCGQIVASRTVFKSYDLSLIAAYMRDHPDEDFAFVDNYHAELGFMARLQRPVADMALKDVAAWMVKHPNGKAIIGYRLPAQIAVYEKILDVPYKRKRMGVFALRAGAVSGTNPP